MKNSQNSNSTEVIFFFGAGASVDAGMPTVSELTKELRNILHELPDVNGKLRPEFKCLFELITEVDKSVEENYEKFFKWLYLLNESQKKPFSKFLGPKKEQEIFKNAGELSFVIGDGIKRILKSRNTEPGYLSQFSDFIPATDHLKIFTLNYDCCLEDACRSAGIDITTGFNTESKKWNPDLFKNNKRGINLYKLHGSLRWFGVRDKNNFRCTMELIELNNENRQSLPVNYTITSYPELILGPESKMQPDDPFITLLYEFHVAIYQAKVCVIIGYGYGDEHINKMLDKALDNGLAILDINIGGPNNRYLSEQRYKHLRNKTKEAIENGLIKEELQKFVQRDI